MASEKRYCQWCGDVLSEDEANHCIVCIEVAKSGGAWYDEYDSMEWDEDEDDDDWIEN